MEDCIFCKIVKGEIPSTKVYEDDQVLAFEDINPISKGHTLIIPKAHAENLWEISDEDLTAVHLASKKVYRSDKESLRLGGGGNTPAQRPGVKSGGHALPPPPRSPFRWAPELPITKWEIKPGDMDTIQQTGQQIAEAIR